MPQTISDCAEDLPDSPWVLVPHGRGKRKQEEARVVKAVGRSIRACGVGRRCYRTRF